MTSQSSMPSDSTPLVQRYDAALFDLDGVVYLGQQAIDAAPPTLVRLRELQVPVGFVTNNASRTPDQVAEHLRALGIQADGRDVVTSAQACARVMAAQLPSGTPVLVTGAEALAREVERVGLRPVWDEAEPVQAVVQGYDPDMTWRRLEFACRALQGGARWFVTNTDANRPTNTGLVPGAGAMVNVVAGVVDVDPVVAGKPERPLMRETVDRLGARNPIFVGDRLDTDMAGANGVQMDSLMVLTGSHGKFDLLNAPESMRPTQVGVDISALLEPALELQIDAQGVRVGQAVARPVEDEVVLSEVAETVPAQLEALWATVNLAWRTGLSASHALEGLHLIH